MPKKTQTPKTSNSVTLKNWLAILETKLITSVNDHRLINHCSSIKKNFSYIFSFNALHAVLFSIVLVCCWLFFKISFLEKLFKEYHQSVNRFQSRPDPAFYWVWFGSETWLQKYSEDDNSRQRVNYKTIHCGYWSESAFSWFWSVSTMYISLKK